MTKIERERRAEVARALAALRKTYGAGSGRPKKLRPCPHCKALLGARELLAHRCEAVPPTPARAMAPRRERS